MVLKWYKLFPVVQDEMQVWLNCFAEFLCIEDISDLFKMKEFAYFLSYSFWISIPMMIDESLITVFVFNNQMSSCCHILVFY